MFPSGVRGTGFVSSWGNIRRTTFIAYDSYFLSVPNSRGSCPFSLLHAKEKGDQFLRMIAAALASHGSA